MVASGFRLATKFGFGSLVWVRINRPLTDQKEIFVTGKYCSLKLMDFVCTNKGMPLLDLYGERFGDECRLTIVKQRLTFLLTSYLELEFFVVLFLICLVY